MLIRLVHKVPTIRLLIPYLLGVVFVSSHLRLAWSLLFFGSWSFILFGYLEKRMATSWSGRWIPGVGFACLWLSLGAFSSAYEHQKSVFPWGENKKM